MSSGLYSHTTRSVGTILTAAIYNSDHQNHITNQNPSMTGGYSDDVTQMKLTSSPGATGSESLAASLADELERLRFAIARIVDQPNWYDAPDFNLGDVGSPIADDSITNAKLANMADGTVKGVAKGAGTGNPTDLTPAQVAVILDEATNVGRAGFLYGLVLENNAADATNDIDVGVGGARDSTDVTTLVLSSGLTKRLDVAWTVGNNQGGLDTGAIANTTYHVWLIKRPDTGVVDVLFSTSSATPVMPTNYTLKRRIGSILRVGGVIMPFTQIGDEFRRKVPLSAADVSTGTAAVAYALGVPTGIRVEAIVSVIMFASNAFNAVAYMLVTAMDQTDTAPSSSLYDLSVFSVASGNLDGHAASQMRVRTNTSAQIRYRVNASSASLAIRITEHGWIDTRGRLGA